MASSLFTTSTSAGRRATSWLHTSCSSAYDGWGDRCRRRRGRRRVHEVEHDVDHAARVDRGADAYGRIRRVDEVLVVAGAVHERVVDVVDVAALADVLTQLLPVVGQP